jgi:ABC-type antimicrobial peptide transport system permease subunit
MAALLAKLALPFLNNVASSIPENTHLLTLGSVLFLLMVAVVVTFLSGFYPAMVLSGFKPALALKSRISMEKVKGISLRRILVITQFAISQVLIIGTIVAVSQMNFIRKADLGFNKESILVTPNNTDSISLLHMDALKQELQKLSGVQSVTMMFDAPSTGNNWESNFNYDHSDKDPGFNVSIKQADADYFKTFGLQFIAGNAYQQSDTLKEMVVNETLLKKLQVKKPQDAIGKTIKMGNRWIPITGVVRDFKTSSLREQTRPLVIVTRKKYYSRIGIKIHSANFSQTVAAIKSLWEKTYPDYVYTPEFMDESIAKFYKQESQMEILYKIFAALAILISCLGLYGLVSFMAQQKTKEIGVRKVLGASVSSIVYLFSKEFTLLILIAFAIALPVAYFLMNSWLVNFAYRIDLGIGIFLMAILASILLAWMTVGYKAIKAALANPVKSLRSE